MIVFNNMKINYKLNNNMKYLILILALFLSVSTVRSQWVSNFNPNPQADLNFSTAKGNAIAVDGAGYSYVTGYCSELFGNNDVVVIKYDLEGDTVWARSYDGTAHSNDEGTGICVDSYGNVYIVGSTQSSGRHYDVTILKYTPEGSLEWAKLYYSFDGYREDKGLDIAIDAEGYIYVTGYTSDGDSKQDMVTIKYDSDGNVIWTRLEDGEDEDNSHAQGLCLVVGPAGNVFVGGFITTDSTGTDMAVVKYDTEGTLQWIRTVNGGNNEEDKAWGIVVDASENVFITGYVTTSVDNTDCFTAKYNSAGTIQWSTTYNGSGNSTDKAWGIVVDTDGTVYITGQYTAAYENTNYLTIKYSSSGTALWTSSYNGTGNGTDIAGAVGILPNPNNTTSIVVTGKSWGILPNYDYATVKYNSTNGQQTSVKRYSMNGVTNDIAKDLAISEDKVYLTGYSQLFVEDSPSEQAYISTMMLDFGNESEMVTGSNLPEKFMLHQNYPNPFNPSTTIKFDVSNKSDVKLAIYDMLGKEVDVLVNQQLEPGSYTISYTNKNLASGVYFYQLRAGEFKEIKKMTLIK
jgi:uncharacterized delta-60 repeat protein